MAQVLVIEDDRDTRTFLSEFLCDDGHVTDEAAEGLTGLKMATQIVPDVILLDVLMPKLDGFQVLEALRANDRTTEIPVVMLSARVEPKDKIRGLQEGAVDYITKPFGVQKLLGTIEAVLSGESQMSGSGGFQ